MSSLSGIRRPGDLPVADAWVPGIAIRLVFVLIATALVLIDYGPGAWFALGVGLAIAAAWRPRSLLAWWLLGFLAAGQLARADALSWRLLVLLAGLHLLHLLAMLMLEVPRRGWMQPEVLLGPLRRFALIQIPAQLVAVLALVLLAPGPHGHRPVTGAAFAGLGTVALLGLAIALVRPTRTSPGEAVRRLTR